MKYRDLDLNLLVVLDALLTEKSVSRAALRLNRSPSAVSMSLARLREHFGDELLAPVGRAMAPTALACELHPRIKDCLVQARSIVDAQARFDAAKCSRRFFLVASDYVLSVLAPPLVRRISQFAPDVTVTFRNLAVASGHPETLIPDALELRRSDLVIVPDERRDQRYPAATLLSDEICCIAWRDNMRLPTDVVDKKDLWSSAPCGAGIR